MKIQLALRTLMLLSITLSSACASLGSPSISDPAQDELTDSARRSLHSLYATTPEARELRARSSGVLIFPDILKAGLLVGASGGNGVLFSPQNEHVLGFYNATSLSYGLQAGVQNYAEAMFFTTPDALSYLDDSNGWSVGAGPSVVVMEEGMARDLSSTTLRSDVYAFIYGQHGLMGGIGIQGQKITKLRSRF